MFRINKMEKLQMDLKFAVVWSICNTAFTANVLIKKVHFKPLRYRPYCELTFMSVYIYFLFTQKCYLASIDGSLIE